LGYVLFALRLQFVGPKFKAAWWLLLVHQNHYIRTWASPCGVDPVNWCPATMGLPALPPNNLVEQRKQQIADYLEIPYILMVGKTGGRWEM
jgi:hypothetical protein